MHYAGQPAARDRVHSGNDGAEIDSVAIDEAGILTLFMTAHFTTRTEGHAYLMSSARMDRVLRSW